MKRKALIIVWLMGLMLCIIEILAFRLIEKPFNALPYCFSILMAMSVLRDREGWNIYGLLQKIIKKWDSTTGVLKRRIYGR